jgi:hypothetical protein
MTIEEAAALLKLTPAWVWQLIKRGTIAGTWNAYARRWEIEPEEVERYRRERRSPGRPRSSKSD